VSNAAPRIRRKDLRKPDQFVTQTAHVVAWVRANSTLAIAVGGGLVALLLAIAIIGAFRSARQRDANEDLGRAMATLRAENLAGAAGELSEVSRRWNGTMPAHLASMLAASTELRLGNVDKAIASLQELDASKDLPPYLRQQLLLVWGYALAQKKSWPEALAKYESAEALGGPYTSQAVLGQARTKEASGDAEAAKSLYRKFYDQFPEAPGRDVVESKIDVTSPAAAS
jgi:outer membrane protein assembly factor BamD (BamD/ComL family)